MVLNLMKDKEIVEKYLTSIKDELMMYSDALSEKIYLILTT